MGFDLGLPEKDLNRAQIACRLVDDLLARILSDKEGDVAPSDGGASRLERAPGAAGRSSCGSVSSSHIAEASAAASINAKNATALDFPLLHVRIERFSR